MVVDIPVAPAWSSHSHHDIISSFRTLVSTTVVPGGPTSHLFKATVNSEMRERDGAPAIPSVYLGARRCSVRVVDALERDNDIISISDDEGPDPPDVINIDSNDDETEIIDISSETEDTDGDIPVYSAKVIVQEPRTVWSTRLRTRTPVSYDERLSAILRAHRHITAQRIEDRTPRRASVVVKDATAWPTTTPKRSAASLPLQSSMSQDPSKRPRAIPNHSSVRLTFPAPGSSKDFDITNDRTTARHSAQTTVDSGGSHRPLPVPLRSGSTASIEKGSGNIVAKDLAGKEPGPGTAVPRVGEPNHASGSTARLSTLAVWGAVDPEDSGWRDLHAAFVQPDKVVRHPSEFQGHVGDDSDPAIFRKGRGRKRKIHEIGRASKTCYPESDKSRVKFGQYPTDINWTKTRQDVLSLRPQLQSRVYEPRKATFFRPMADLYIEQGFTGKADRHKVQQFGFYGPKGGKLIYEAIKEMFPAVPPAVCTPLKPDDFIYTVLVPEAYVFLTARSCGDVMRAVDIVMDSRRHGEKYFPLAPLPGTSRAANAL